MRGNTRFISSVERDIMFNMRNKSGIFKHTISHVRLSVLLHSF